MRSLCQVRLASDHGSGPPSLLCNLGEPGDHIGSARCRTPVRNSLQAGLEIRAKLGALRQIVFNLLDDAVRFGPAVQTVVVGSYGSAGRVRIFVEDQGPGIPSTERSRAWRDSAVTPYAAGAATGSGLGLSVVQVLTSEMNGLAWVEDGGNGGARFIVEFPLSNQEHQDDHHPLEFDLLLALVRRRGGLVTHTELLREVWGYRSDAESRTVDTHIGRLRAKLDPLNDKRIVTVRKSGYRLMGSTSP